MADRLITTRTGRRLGVTGLGDPASRRLVIFFHPMPGAGSFDPDPAITRHTVHMMGVDRPGYGSSPALPEGTAASLEGFADDVAQYIADLEDTAASIGSESFGPVGVIGWGVGGVYAMSFAARHPRLVDRLALIDAPRPDRDLVPSDVLAAPDESAFRSHPGIRRRIEEMLDQGAVHGDAGIDADRAALETAAESLADVRIDTESVLVYGAEHPVVDPHDDGEWFRARMPHARVVTVTDSTHLAIGAAWSRILDEVAPFHGEVSHALRSSPRT